jgi:hypothetical protein
MKLGRRYRINDPVSLYDGRVGTLEHVHGAQAWVLFDTRLIRVSVAGLTDKNVLQIDYQPRHQLVWGDAETL